MSNLGRVIQRTIKASQQRKKFAEGGDVDDWRDREARLGLALQQADERKAADATRTWGDTARDVVGFPGRLYTALSQPPSWVTPPTQEPAPGDRIAQARKVLSRPGPANVVPNLVGGLAEAVHSGVTAPGDALTGKLPMTDETGHTSQEAVKRGFDLASIAGGASAAGTAERAAARSGTDLRILGKQFGKESEPVSVTPQLDRPPPAPYKSGDIGVVDAAGAPKEAGLDVGPGLAGPLGGGEGLRAAELQAQRWAGPHEPVPGLPRGAQIVDGQPFIPGPNAAAHDVARAYMADKDFGLPPHAEYRPVDVEHAKAIAKAFDEMSHAPNDPVVKAAYEAMAQETLAQYKAIVERGGLKVTPVNAADYPYHGNPRAVAKDIADNNHMAFFKTDEGFGSGDAAAAATVDHPLLKSSGVKVGDHDMLYNDLFRVVHDYFGHVKNGFGFRGAGEDNAWRAHAPMYSPEARRAMTTETRGQNSWLNYGPHGDFNRTASAADTIYAPQKIGLLPEWVMQDRVPSGTTLASDSAKPGAVISAAEHAPKFYSAAERAVEAVPQARMSGAQWLGTLASKGGVKAEEMQWSGLGDYLLKKKDAPVTKAEVQEHLGANRLELGEVNKGGGDVEALARKLAEEENGPGSWDRIGGGGQEHYWRDARRDLGTKYQDYQLPGGENYREKLLTLPPRGPVPMQRSFFLRKDGEIIAEGDASAAARWRQDHGLDDGSQNSGRYRIEEKDVPDPRGGGNVYRSSHWDEPNVLAHRRSNERDVNGQRSLHIEEIQSDWHQAGRKRGYAGDSPPPLTAEQIGRVKEIMPQLEEMRRNGMSLDQVRETPLGREATALQDIHREFNAYQKRGDIPDAPFRKNWHELALKDAIREAAEKGINRISWTAGEAQAARYDLSRQVEKIGWAKRSDGTYDLSIHPKGRDRGSEAINYDKKTPEEMASIIGKEAAEKITGSPGERTHISGYHSAGDLVGPDLKVGGEGMKGFYDKIIPDALNKVGKAHGVKVQKGSTSAGIDPNKHYEGPSYTLEQLRRMPPTDRNSVNLERQYRAVMRDVKAGVPFAEAMQENASIALAEQFGGKMTNRNKIEPVHYMDIPQSLKDQALKKGFSLFEDSGAAGKPIAAVSRLIDDPDIAHKAPSRTARRYYDGPEVTNAGVNAPTNKSIQTVAEPHRMMFPGIYRNPREIAAEAASRVGAEDPAMKQLFGVTRGDLREMARGRVGNEEPNLSLAPNPRGSLAAQNIDTPRNTQRLVDILDEAGKHEGLRTADAWYIMDPVYKRLESMFGPEEAVRRYRHLNTTMGMASPGSDVLSEIQRGTGAHWLEQQGRFGDFTKYAGLTGEAKKSLKVPADIRYIGGHPYHRTSQGEPMQKYFDAGSIQSESPKVPLYVHASGVPETGFQTKGPVGDAHFSRGVGLADTRKGPTDVGSSFSRSEYQTLQPWWQHNVAKQVGLESVPAQARLWTGLGPQTGVESELGATKLELLSKQIIRAARRLKISPETARDLILSGKAGAGAIGAGVMMGSGMGGDRQQYSYGGKVRRFAEGGDVNDAAPVFDPTRLAAAQPRFDPAKLSAAKKPDGPMTASDVLSGAVENAPSSAWQFAKDIVSPIIHPLDTLGSIKDLGLGLLEKSGAVGTVFPGTGGDNTSHIKYADAMGQYLKDRYGGLENIKKSVAKDPVGVLSDASMILTGGGSAAARVPGIAGKVGEVAANVGRAVDPLLATVNAAKVGTKVVGETLTHTGAAPLENAYKAGVEGGEAGETFRSHMRGTADSVEPVMMAKSGLEGYRASRAKTYREARDDITSLDRQMAPQDRILDFGKIDDAVDKARKVQTFGTRVLDKGANEVRNSMIAEINEWKALDPVEYHTIDGMDALKRSLGHMMMDTQPGTSSRKAAGEIYNAVRQTIVDYDPKYAKVMKDYEQASIQIRELERAMSLGEKASADTALRKLQSIMRNNVNTNYGRRLELGKLLEEHGATHLMAALSGQSLNAWAPRGLGKLGAEAAIIGGAGHFISPWTLAATPLMSPRLMGEVSHGVGRTFGRGLKATNSVLGGVGGNRAAGNASYRLGRATNPYENTDDANPYAP